MPTHPGGVRLPAILQGIHIDGFDPQRPVPVFTLADPRGRLPGARSGRPDLPVGQIRTRGGCRCRTAAVHPDGRLHQRPGREPVPLRAVRALHPAAAGPLVPVDRQPRDPVHGHRRDHHRPGLPDRGGILLLRGVRRALQHRRVRLPRVSDGGVHRHLGCVPGDEGARRGRDTGGAGRLLPAQLDQARVRACRPLARAARGVRAVCRGVGPCGRALSDECVVDCRRTAWKTSWCRTGTAASSARRAPATSTTSRTTRAPSRRTTSA